jgi:hypothetical protein
MLAPVAAAAPVVSDYAGLARAVAAGHRLILTTGTIYFPAAAAVAR